MIRVTGAAAGAVLAAAWAVAQPSAPGFIAARGGALVEGDREFRFMSFNVPNLHYIEDDLRFAQANPFRWPDEYEVDDALASIRQMGGRVARLYALSVRKAGDPAGTPRHVLGPGRFDEEGFRALDAVLDLARRHGVRLVVPLVDNWSWWGGVTEYAAFRGRARAAFWTDPQLAADFEATVRFVLTRVNTRSGVAYRDDPTILAWETGNELECPRAWTRRVAVLMKALDPNHLVLDGTRAEVLAPETIADPSIDVVQTHHYESDAATMIAHIRRSAAAARGRKPYLVGEFGFLPATAMAAVMDVIASEGLAGGFVWSLRGHDRDGGFYWHREPHGHDVYGSYHWPGFASGDAYGETALLRAVRRRAFALRGEREPGREAPATPEIVAVTPGALMTWRGAAGASVYDVERADAANGPWRVIAHGVSDARAPYRPQFCDETATPGRSAWFRVAARNEAGSSPPSAPFGPVTVTHRTRVDELDGDGRVFATRGNPEFRRDDARAFEEDPHGVEGDDGAAVIYRTPAALTGGRVYAFVVRAGQAPAFAASRDGVAFAAFAPPVKAFAAGDSATYGFRIPVLARLEGVPPGTRFLRIGLRRGVRVTRVELEYREETPMTPERLREAIEDELRANLLPFWRGRSVDDARGGFIGEMADDGTVNPGAAHGLVLNARYLWTFSALFRQLGDARDRELARRAYGVLKRQFLDREHGGYEWRLNADGRPLDRSKKVYGQAFCIYALAEYSLATGDAGALDAARRVYALIEEHARDRRHGGYLEARAADWSPTAELRLSDGDMLAPKSMNTNLHVLEAYSNLYRAWPDPGLAARLRELIGVFGRHILAGAGPNAGHLQHFFGEGWEVRSDTYTYGHDIEASWLLDEAADALGDPELVAEVRRWSVAMARAALREALGADGGLGYEGRGGAMIDARRDWWCQAEAVIGFWNAYAATGEKQFEEAAARVWAFVAGRVVDRAGGDWFWRVGADGAVDHALPKVSEWKCPYHNVRMCLEMARRLGSAANGAGR